MVVVPKENHYAKQNSNRACNGFIRARLRRSHAGRGQLRSLLREPCGNWVSGQLRHQSVEYERACERT